MTKVELLSPAGNMECLIAAINAGADAVYLSGKNFGARAFAGNFTNEEIVEAIKYAHLRDTKIYITVNTIIYENEMEEVYNYLKFLYENNVDAVIVQDLGIIKLISERLPLLEIHASTQCHNHNLEGINLLKKYNVKRVVLDREMSLEEIKPLTNRIDIEVFVHGALCVSYSGCCLFSKLEAGRSGNRGQCIQSCRHSYSLHSDDKNIDKKYILSTKELCTVNYLPNLIESGIKSFKIEGRMKSPTYVGIVTSIYRKYIDNYYNNVTEQVSDEDIKKLMKLFNRKFASGFINGEKNIINSESSNHQGIEIGKVIDVNDKKITISLNEPLYQNDGIRFKNSEKGMIVNKLYDKKGLLQNSAKSIAILDNKVELKKHDIVLKTIDYKLEKESIFPDKKIPINIEIHANIGQRLKAIVTSGNIEICKEGPIVEKAIKMPTTKENIIKQFTKTGDTVYSVSSINVNNDENIFINITDLNNLRRELLKQLDEIKIGIKQNIINAEAIDNKSVIKDHTVKINFLVRNENQLKTVLNMNIGDIYTSDYELYKKYENKIENIYFKERRVNNAYRNIDVKKVLISEIGSIEKYKNKYIISDYSLNVINKESIRFLENNDIKRITLSIENNMDNLKQLELNKHNCEMLVYGRVELMIIKSPIIDTKGYLENQYKEHFPIYKDDNIVVILSKNSIDNIANIKDYKDYGINNYRVDLYDENEEKILNIVNKINSYLK